jgi:hypothetical protein
MNLNDAKALFQEAHGRLSTTISSITSVTSEIELAKDAVRAVIHAGIDPSGAQEIMGLIEETENAAHQVISLASAARDRAEEVGGL